MSLKLGVVQFESASIGAVSRNTEDRKTLSVLFDGLVASHQPIDGHDGPQVICVDGVIHCDGAGCVSVQVRGGCYVAGRMGVAHAMVWVNGKPLGLIPLASEDAGFAATTVSVTSGGSICLSLTALALRDMRDGSSAAECWIDSVDIQVLDHPPGVQRSKRATAGAAKD